MFWAIFMIALAGVALAQPAGHSVVSGVVVEASSGEAVRKAVVTLTWQGTPRSWATTRTDGSGRFRFEGLPAGKYDLRAVKTGIGTAFYGGNSVRELGEFVVLGDGENGEGITLKFIHSGSVAGRVLDADGDPLVGIPLVLMRAGRNLGERVLVNYRNATTNDRGEYRFTNLDPGQYYPVAEVSLGGQEAPIRVPVSQFYGGARVWKDARPVTVRSGEILTRIDFNVTKGPLVRVRGRVTGMPSTKETTQPALVDGHPRYRGIGVNIMSAETGPGGLGQTGVGALGPDYRFDFGDLPEGRYRLEAQDQFDGPPYAMSQVVDVRQGMGEILLTLTPARELKGQLRLEGSGAPPLNSFTIQLGLGMPVRRSVRARVGSDGHFTLVGLMEGEWGMNVNPLPRGQFLKSAMLGDKDVRFTLMEIGSGTDATLNIVVSMNSATVEGEVDASGADSTRAGILLAPFGAFHNLARFYYNATADGNGKFKLERIAPGKYKIFALEKMAAVNFQSPEAADQLDALGTEIELKEGTTTQARPKLIPMERAREALQ
jgi:hypothetical protein